MLKPPASTMPGMTDTLDFVKNLWGSMNIPGTGMPGMSGLASPTLSTDDLDKRIADLKAVESWLNMNITMLRGTIQAMEVQRGTLAALKSMGASMAEAMRQSGVSADKLGAMPFTSFFNPAAGAPAADAGASQHAPAPSPAPDPAAAKPAGGDTAQPGAAAPAGTEGAGGGAAMGMPAALAWWNLLQDQFQQAVSSAMSSSASATPGGAAAATSSTTPDKKDAKAAKPAAPAPADSPQTGAPAGSSGNGKSRTPRSRADKA